MLENVKSTYNLAKNVKTDFSHSSFCSCCWHSSFGRIEISVKNFQLDLFVPSVSIMLDMLVFTNNSCCDVVYSQFKSKRLGGREKIMCESKIIFMLAPTTKFGTRTFYWHWGVCIVRPWILHALETKIKWERSGQIYGLHVRAKFWLNSTPLSEAKVSRALTSLDKLIERSIANVIIWQSWCCLFGFGMFVYVIGWNVCAYFFCNCVTVGRNWEYGRVQISEGAAARALSARPLEIVWITHFASLWSGRRSQLAATC